MAVYTVSIGDGSTLSSLAVSAGRGPKGDGFTGGSYNSDTGIVTFTSNDGIGFSTDDLRGDLSEPGPIGDVTPNTGAFTSLSSTGDTVIGGNLTVEGTTTTVDSTTVAIADKNIELAKDATTAAEADGGGITLNGADATITYSSTSEHWSLNKNLNVSGNVSLSGTVDGRDVATDGSKLDGIESNATADQTASEIKTAYESNADTNAFTDAEQSKLAGIESGAEVNTVDSVNTQTGTVVLDADDIDDSTTTNKFTTAADKSKLDGIETNADVTDTANVTAAGALMDSELTDEASVKALDQGVATTDSPEFAGLQVAGNNIPTSGPLSGFRNAIINGNFAINQRGVSGTVTLSAGEYGHDRWKAGASGCTYTFATSDNVTTLTITAGSLVQVIEGENLFTDTYTLSWTGTAQGKIGAGSYGASGTTGSVTGGTNLSIEFNTGTVSQVQLEAGSVATPFERRPVGTELALCQRYYHRVTRLGGGGYATSSGQLARAIASIVFPVKMRVSPSVSINATPAGNSNGVVGHSLSTADSHSISYESASSGSIYWHFAGDDYIAYDAEL